VIDFKRTKRKQPVDVAQTGAILPCFGTKGRQTRRQNYFFMFNFNNLIFGIKIERTGKPQTDAWQRGQPPELRPLAFCFLFRRFAASLYPQRGK
jgi:hypothetical protein